MSKPLQLLQSTILSKVVMAATGVILILFVLGHMLGNLQIFIGQDQFNDYAEKLQSLGPGLWAIRLFLLLCVVLHIITSLYLKKLNSDARPVQYVYQNTVQATLASRTMLISGLMIFFFVVYHLLHFTIGTIEPSTFKGTIVDYAGRPDVYSMVIYGFQNIFISASYLIAMVLLGFHLIHAVPSMFQTLGINHPKCNPLIHGLGPVLSVIIVVGYISIPIAILAGFVTLPKGVM
ncbi:MAG: hypothetical protein CL946_08120 [Ectothiorhodospiraceae bacterium]|nr:hypothetical protein [Ectothiorhodospiraceae bacterium]